MKVLFAVSNEEVSENIVKKYQKEYKEIISYKNVYYFNAILKELQKDKTYDRIVISEDLEAFANNQYDQIDKFIFEKLDSISDEASNFKGDDIPIILICSDRRTKSEQMLVKLFGIGIYNALLGTDRTVEELCKLINKPRLKKEGKAYYKIDVEDVKYKAENENDVSEVEIQNILAHYKRLGKNEDKYIESFDNIAAQYNDTQLRIIAKFLPLNVRAVLEEKSPKYQKVMSFNAKITDNLRKRKNEEEAQGTTQKLLKTTNTRETVLSRPVVIPNAVNVEKGKKMSRPKPKTQEASIKEIESEINNYVRNAEEQTKQNMVAPEIEYEEPEEIQPVKRGRGRPKKNILPTEDVEETVKKKRGRPKKIVEEEQLDEDEFEDFIMPGVEEHEEVEDAIMPGFEDFDNEQEDFEESKIPNQEDFKDEQSFSPEPIQQSVPTQRTIVNETPRIENDVERVMEPEEQVDLSSILTEDKKIACFVGTSKNGTSFIVNHMAEILSEAGVSTAILDTTQNRNSYYIYTDNQEELRNAAANSINNLINGQANGLQVNKNLSVYTPLPGEESQINRAGEILKTLVQNYSVVLIDCDFKTPASYFSYAQEIYLIQSLDVLTIQPLTSFLNELKAKQVLEERKLRIILNKFEKLRGISDKLIIGGMSSYNDPEMSYMVELFDKNLIRYITIPFDEQVYVNYLEGLINCQLTLKGYPKHIMQILTELASMIHPIDTGKGKKKGSGYVPPALNNTNNNGFTPSINSTLEQMRKY